MLAGCSVVSRMFLRGKRNKIPIVICVCHAWHMPYWCLAYAVHVSGICRTRVCLMPYTCTANAGHLLIVTNGNGMRVCSKRD